MKNVERTLLLFQEAVLFGTYLAFNRMGRSKGSGRGGLVINIASLAAIAPGNCVLESSYFASKAAVVGLTKTMGSKEVFREEGVQVKALCPFYADTNIVNDDKE